MAVVTLSFRGRQINCLTALATWEMQTLFLYLFLFSLFFLSLSSPLFVCETLLKLYIFLRPDTEKQRVCQDMLSGPAKQGHGGLEDGEKITSQWWFWPKQRLGKNSQSRQNNLTQHKFTEFAIMKELDLASACCFQPSVVGDCYDLNNVCLV